jgi:phosphopantothenoylcysteine decarboxylase/phosphopantothenate--cysteine ligase
LWCSKRANELSAATGQRILLGVTGGIAAYKAVEILRLLRKGGAEVRVVMTRAATEFVGPLTFQALSGHPVRVEVLDADEESAMGHIRLARWADLVLVAPASADFMARLRAGMADDLLTTLCLATTAPLWLAPAMNQAMWAHPATRENTAALRQRGITLIGPAEGDQACGETGPGRLAEPIQIVERLFGFSEDRALAGLRVLISAGPTREAIDPVRYLTNRSSGKMGYALALAAKTMGAEVRLVSGPTALAVPDVSEVTRVESARDMHAAVLQRAPSADIYIGAAAVADYAPTAAPEKIKKDAGEVELRLIRNPDILADVARIEQRPFCVGFSAETNDLEQYARGKLAAKHIDMVAANPVGAGLGFDVDDNTLFVCWAGGETRLPRAPKSVLARQLLNLIAQRYHAHHSAQDPR